LDFTPEMTLVRPATMDVGNDELGKAKGVRSIKFYPDRNANPNTRYQGNDMPVLRLADVMMMKAEAILRGAAATSIGGELQTADVLVNKIRSRAKAPLITGVTLDQLLDERAREFAWEGWRRNDLIRFGRFENAWGFKNNTDVNKRIYPVPTSERSLNPDLVQNPGY
jgi:starch-binding outer membrane protein, SusD/RagB family